LSFLLPCPNCGPRSACEFDFGGEHHPRPPSTAAWGEWTDYLYLKANSEGEQTEWWFHTLGCGLWILAVRNTSSNEVRSTFWPERVKGERP
jgi:heterotetrameric sarcosine oxidase delta subunit